VRWIGVQPILQVADFTVHRADGWSIALPALALEAGSVSAVHGPSGCGKTTLLQALFGLLDREQWATSGRVRVRGRDLAIMSPQHRRHVLRHDLAILMQDAHSALDPLQPVGRQIEQATHCSERDAVAMLRRLGVADALVLVRRLPHEISGGQAQRVLLAIAFLRAPALVVADEPSASLDGGSYKELLQHLRALVEQGSAVLLATHDQRLLRDLDAGVLALEQGVFRRARPQHLPWPPRADRDDIGTVPVLAARGLRVAFGQRTVLDGVDFHVCRGETVAVVGESGAGKTTLGRVLAGHRRPDAGSVERPTRIGAVQLVCQDALGSLTPGRPLRALLAEAQAPYFDLAAAANELRLEPGVLDRPAGRLSGGERRRVALLRAVAVQPDVLVLDEPTASLDRATGIGVIDALLRLQAGRSLALVVITHDLELAEAFAHRIVTIRGGRLWTE
jgi:ABC-type glutathione transport system ATPase component